MNVNLLEPWVFSLSYLFRLHCSKKACNTKLWLIFVTSNLACNFKSSQKCTIMTKNVYLATQTLHWIQNIFILKKTLNSISFRFENVQSCWVRHKSYLSFHNVHLLGGRNGIKLKEWFGVFVRTQFPNFASLPIW